MNVHKNAEQLYCTTWGMFPHKLIQFLEDFNQLEANWSLYTPATNITEEGGTFLLLSEKNGSDERLSDDLIRLGARPVIFQYSLYQYFAFIYWIRL